MDIKNISISFANTAEEEVLDLVSTLRLIPLAKYLQTEESIPEELKDLITPMLTIFMDLFSVDPPDLADPETTLRQASRDINLARLLRERGIFRMYRLINHKVWVNPNGKIVEQKDIDVKATQVPAFMTMRNPFTGVPFATQEDFIGWFCEDAHVARSLVFMRLATIGRLQALGFNLSDAFKLVLSKPYVIQEALKDGTLAGWDKNTLASINPDVAVAMARRLNPSNTEKIEQLAANVKADPENMPALIEKVKPIMASIISEAAAHDRAGDAMSMIQHDILMQPELVYSWDYDSNALVVELKQVEVDPASKTAYQVPSVIVPFVPDTLKLPDAIIKDLMKRLPIKNKRS